MQHLRSICTYTSKASFFMKNELEELVSKLTTLTSLPKDAGLFAYNRDLFEGLVSLANDAIFQLESVTSSLEAIYEKAGRQPYLNVDELYGATFRQRFFKVDNGELVECSITEMPEGSVEDSELEIETTTIKERLFKVQAAANAQKQMWDEELETKFRQENRECPQWIYKKEM